MLFVSSTFLNVLTFLAIIPENFTLIRPQLSEYSAPKMPQARAHTRTHTHTEGEGERDAITKKTSSVAKVKKLGVVKKSPVRHTIPNNKVRRSLS